jgi:hypothetical protein
VAESATFSFILYQDLQLALMPVSLFKITWVHDFGFTRDRPKRQAVHFWISPILHPDMTLELQD